MFKFIYFNNDFALYRKKQRFCKRHQRNMPKFNAELKQRIAGCRSEARKQENKTPRVIQQIMLIRLIHIVHLQNEKLHTHFKSQKNKQSKLSKRENHNDTRG